MTEDKSFARLTAVVVVILVISYGRMDLLHSVRVRYILKLYGESGIGGLNGTDDNAGRGGGKGAAADGNAGGRGDGADGASRALGREEAAMGRGERSRRRRRRMTGRKLLLRRGSD